MLQIRRASVAQKTTRRGRSLSWAGVERSGDWWHAQHQPTVSDHLPTMIHDRLTDWTIDARTLARVDYLSLHNVPPGAIDCPDCPSADTLER